ncbi:non-canonical purine NTP diphosphatase [Flavobacterium agricola]|uniref:dITP/XTP pyrophosphatase n=1 Tax=Flavobacterium agricola TaxID=2870839 RepID=A0ABY6M1D3_9FLAO|nr:non-canonical purine NTP diphosphatase [Flavobacterium agricola]UYW02374.1 non-canonical purine NTP diphosphatase [Flavobacterium agricola]
MTKLVFASHNENKIKEVKKLLENQFEIVSLTDIGCFEDIPETAETIEGNAILKANYVTEKYGLNCFADDSGLLIDALNGAPGVYSARFAGEHKNDTDNLNLALQKLENETNRKAHFKTIMALNLNGEQHLFEGIVQGDLTTQPIGNNGFGYDPIFVPEGYTETFAQLSLEEKSKMSHRGKALQKMVQFLKA